MLHRVAYGHYITLCGWRMVTACGGTMLSVSALTDRTTGVCETRTATGVFKWLGPFAVFRCTFEQSSPSRPVRSKKYCEFFSRPPRPPRPQFSGKAPPPPRTADVVHPIIMIHILPGQSA